MSRQRTNQPAGADQSRLPAAREQLKVFAISKEATCGECGAEMLRGDWITLDRSLTPNCQGGPLCLSCGDLVHLSFLPAGDAALTRRAAKHSSLTAVVLKWSRARKRYERQGLLVTQEALDRAEQECLADHDLRERRRMRESARRAELDLEYLRQFANRVRELFPACPAGCEQQIAEHACRKYSGRVGRSAAAKELDEAAIHLAVAAHVRHAETRYDELLLQGWDRYEARTAVQGQVQAILSDWQAGCTDGNLSL